MGTLRRSLGCIAALSILVAACSVEQRHGYAQSSDGSLSFRYPAEWTDVGLEPTGLDWVAAIDASSDPSLDHVDAGALDDPVIQARVWTLQPEIRDDINLDVVRSLAIGEGEIDPATARIVIDERIVDDQGFEGHHTKYEHETDGGTVVEEHLVLLGPARGTVHRISIACSLTCFEVYGDDIDEVFDSVRLRP